MSLALRLPSGTREQSRCKTGARAKAIAESKDDSRAAQRPDEWFHRFYLQRCCKVGTIETPFPRFAAAL